MSYTLHHGDCLDEMAAMDAESVDAIVADPPYNIGKAAWDKVDGYLEWSETWIAEASRVLKRNGAFWCFHSKPLVLADLSRVIERHGRGQVNWITWWKHNGSHELSKGAFAMDVPSNRSFFPNCEYAVWHADEGDWTKQGAALWSGDFDHKRTFIFEPLRAYLDDERHAANLVDDDARRRMGLSTKGGGLLAHYWGSAQWMLPTQRQYEKLREAYPGYFRREYEDLRREYECLHGKYEDLRREYEDLRREYLHLRYTFNNPGKVSSVWQFPPAKPNGHPTPKPVDLMRRIVSASTNPGDLVLDPFCGSGSTGVACALEGREFIGIEREAEYVEIARRRIEAASAQTRLPVDTDCHGPIAQRSTR